MAEDYYKLLGVSQTATKDEIKSAFRKLAMKYHPDKNKGDKAAEEQFKKINEAYAVLSNDEKRKQYDTIGAEGFSRRFSQEDIFKDIDLGSIFKEFGLGDLLGGRGGSFSFGFGSPFGGGRRRGGFTGNFGEDETAPPPANAETELHISLEDAVFGARKRVSLDTGSGIEQIDVTIPKGMEDGKKLRLKGKGPMNPVSGQRGDLLCKIMIDPHPLYLRKGNDLIMDVHVKLTEMVLGGKVRVMTIDRKEIELKIPPLSKNNSLFRIKGKGVPGLRDQPAGHLLVRLQVELPSFLDDHQKQLFEHLAKTGL
ncbi:MAG: DnaJ C-terminal domain-containing protein [Candidatus Omnitrophota bacterium]